MKKNRLRSLSPVTPFSLVPRGVRVSGRSFAAALALVSTVATPPATVAQKLSVGLRRPCRGQVVNRRITTLGCYRLHLCSGKVALADFYLSTSWVVDYSSAAALILAVNFIYFMFSKKILMGGCDAPPSSSCVCGATKGHEIY